MATPSNVLPPKHTPGRDLDRTMVNNPAGNSISNAELRRVTGKPAEPRQPVAPLKKRVSLLT